MIHFLSESVYCYLMDLFGPAELFLEDDDYGNFAVFFAERDYDDYRYRYCRNCSSPNLRTWAKNHYSGNGDFKVDDIYTLKRLQQEFHIFD